MLPGGRPGGGHLQPYLGPWGLHRIWAVVVVVPRVSVRSELWGMLGFGAQYARTWAASQTPSGQPEGLDSLFPTEPGCGRGHSGPWRSVPGRASSPAGQPCPLPTLQRSGQGWEEARGSGPLLGCACGSCGGRSRKPQAPGRLSASCAQGSGQPPLPGPLPLLPGQGGPGCLRTLSFGSGSWHGDGLP